MPRIYDFPQYSPEYWQIRAKKMTASNATAIGNYGTGLRSYIHKMMREYYSTAPQDNFSNKHTERGLDLEDSAGLIYTAEQKIPVKKVGFVVHSQYVGCSPDLLAGDDGLCEIKCLDDAAHFELILGSSPASGFIWQCQMQMLVCKKNWADLTFYNPNFVKYKIIFRILPDTEKVSKLQKGMIMGKQMIEEIERKMETKK